VSLAYRWFCKLGIEDAVPDHSALSRACNERKASANMVPVFRIAVISSAPVCGAPPSWGRHPQTFT
jgi:hypothetical protein